MDINLTLTVQETDRLLDLLKTDYMEGRIDSVFFGRVEEKIYNGLKVACANP